MNACVLHLAYVPVKICVGRLYAVCMYVAQDVIAQSVTEGSQGFGPTQCMCVAHCIAQSERVVRDSKKASQQVMVDKRQGFLISGPWAKYGLPKGIV